MNCCKKTYANGFTFNARMGQVNAASTDYNKLNNKPSINGVTLVGDKTSDELNLTGDKQFVFTQNTASEVWEIKHDLNKYPSVTIVDSADSVVIGEVATGAQVMADVTVNQTNYNVTISIVGTGTLAAGIYRAVLFG